MDAGAWHGRDHGRALPCYSPISKWGESRNSHQRARKKSRFSPGRNLQLGSYFLPSSFHTPFLSQLHSPNSKPDLEALSSPAVGAGGPEHPALLPGVLIRCQGRKGSLWVSHTAAQTLSSDIFPALALPCPGGPMF